MSDNSIVARFEAFAKAYKYDIEKDGEGEYLNIRTYKTFVAYKNGFRDVAERAKQLMDQVLKTWDPPRFTGNERPEDIAQTSVMLAIARIMGREFLPSNLTVNQQAAVDSGLELFNEVLESPADERQPTIDEWMEEYEAAVEAGQSRISREEAERRYDAKYGRHRQQNDDY